MKRPLGVQISHMLKDRGIEVIFGIPGVHNQELYRGIEEAGLMHILARHEQGAGFMADGYARATGRPGVCYVITGPGLCNIMTAMGQAYSDSVPMLVISSCLDETAARRGQLHQMKDQRAAAETVCDWSQEARTAEAAYALIDRAFMEFETSRQRPKHVQAPISLLETQAPAAPNAGFAPSGQAADTSDCRDLVDALNDSNRPLFIVGGGVEKDITPLLQKCGAAAFMSYAGRGLIAEDYPFSFGSTLARGNSVEMIASADLVVVLGCELAEVDLWRDALGRDAPLYRVDLDPEVLADTQRADWTILGDCADVIANLSMHELMPAQGWDAKEIARCCSLWRAEVDAEYPGILHVMDALKECLPEGTMIYSDMTQFAYAAKEVWTMDRPGHWHHPSGFGTLGYALPAAIGGQIGRPGKPTLAIAGDYGFQYTMQELAVAVELGLPLPIFIWDNGKLGAIEHSMAQAQIAPNAVVARNPEFVTLAKAFGAYAGQPSTLSEMQDMLHAAFKADGPTLIHVSSGIA